MSTHDPIEQRLDHLAKATDGVSAPPGLEARVLGRLRAARRPDSFWDIAFGLSLRVVPVAACTAVVAVALAFWQDGRLTDSLALSARAPTDVELGDP